MQAGWNIRERELWLVDPAGNASAPAAADIYRALVDRRPSEPWIPTTVDGLRPSRYPLSPTLTIVEDGGFPAYTVCGSARGVTLDLGVADLRRGYIIADDVWHPVDPTTSQEVLELLRSTGASIGPVSSLRTLLALRKIGVEGGPVDDRLADDAIPALFFAPPADDIPAGVDATLYPYQLAGWRWLKFLLVEGIGGLLADEMGLGKTLQVIAVLSDSGENEPLRPSLIIAPGSLLENWRREIAKFAPRLRVLKHHGPMRTGRPTEMQVYDAVITSYDNAVSDNSLFNMIQWRVVVLDEAQFIRNPNAQRTKAVKRLRRDAGLAMTGTPVENRLLDLWSIMDFVLPGHLGDAKAFEAQFTDDMGGAARLEPLVSPLMLRRRVAEVAKDLPPRIDIPQVIELDDDEASAYDAERQRIVKEYGAAATLVALTSLRRFCAHPSLMDGTSAYADPMSFSKFRRLDEIIGEIFARCEKVIIFTSFTAMGDMIARHVETVMDVFAGVIDGRLAIDDRQPMIDRFSVVRGEAVLVLNPKAGGAGLNITAANHVVHYNPEWNPALEDQASARAHRRGQELPVTVHHLLIADTVEEVVNERLNRKRALFDAAVIGSAGKDEDYGDIVAALNRSPTQRARR